MVPSVQKKTGPVAGDINPDAGEEGGDGEEKAKPKGGKKASKPKKEETSNAEVELATTKGSKGKKRTIETKDEEPVVNGHESDEEESKPANKKRKPNAKVDANGAAKAKKERTTKAQPEPEKSERRRSGRVSGKFT